jgi:hypothetical protein
LPSDAENSAFFLKSTNNLFASCPNLGESSTRHPSSAASPQLSPELRKRKERKRPVKRFSLALLALAAALATTLTLGSVSARADGTEVSVVSSTGAGIPGDWSQEWEETSVGPFDTILVFSRQGDGLVTPGLTDVSGGWTETDLSPSGYASELTGPATSDYYFDTNFVDPGSNDVFDFFALYDGKIVDSGTFDNYGGGGSLGYGMYLEDTMPSLANDMSDVTPEPSSLLLLGTGLLGLAVILFRKEKASGLTSNA